MSTTTIPTSPTPSTWQERVAMASRLSISAKRRAEPPKPNRAIRREIIRDARIALDPKATIKSIKLPAESGDQHDPREEWLSLPGIYRMILSNDVPAWKEPMVAENVMGIVQRTIEVELTDPTWPAA